LWWLGRSLLNGREIHWIMAAGRGGQSIRIVPELDLVAPGAGWSVDVPLPSGRGPRAFAVLADTISAVRP